MQELRDAIDPEGPGGAYMLGLRQLGVVAHGRFSARGFAQAIDVAARGVQHDVIGRTRAALQEAGALRPRPRWLRRGRRRRRYGSTWPVRARRLRCQPR